MRMFICTILLFLFFCVSTQAVAQMTEKEIQTEIYDNIAGDFINCGVYFTIVTEGAKKAGELNLAKEYDALVDQCYGSAFALIKSNRDEEMANEVSLSWVSMTNSTMRDKIGNNYSNLSILTNKYSKRCISIIKDPDVNVSSLNFLMEIRYY